MNRTIMISELEHPSAEIGKLKIPDLGVDIDFSGLPPYVGGREDFEVILRYPEILKNRQPLEVNGFRTHTILRRALSLQEELQGEGIYGTKQTPYETIAMKHPIVISFPSEVIWLNRMDGVDCIKKNMRQVLPHTDFGFNQKQIDYIGKKFEEHIRNSQQKYYFWRAIVRDKLDGETMSKIMMEWTIQNAIDAKGKWLAGITPLIDAKTRGSVTYSHRINRAYGSLIQGRIDQGIESPALLYTLNLNSTIIDADSWTPILEEIVRNTRLAFTEDREYYEGIFISVRGLEIISRSHGRVNTLMKLMLKINEIAKSEIVPVWWSRLGPAGFAAIDMGTTFCSFPINMRMGDVFIDGGPTEEKYKYGRIYNPTMRARWYKDQVIKSKSSPDKGMPKLKKYWSKNYPTSSDLDSPSRYRINFSKPYNVAAINNLFDQWEDNIKNGETNPGMEYLQSFEPPYDSWGLR